MATIRGVTKILDMTAPKGVRRRELMIQVIGAQGKLAPVMYTIGRARRCDAILGWLIESKLTGQELWEWFVIEHQSSALNLMAYVLKRVTKDVKRRPLIFGKDWS